MQFDVTLKEIFQTPPTRLLEMLRGNPVAELLNIEQLRSKYVAPIWWSG